MRITNISSIIISVIVILILVIIIVLTLNQMGERFINDCEKQGNQGIVSYWDIDIDCSNNLKDFDTINLSSQTNEQTN